MIGSVELILVVVGFTVLAIFQLWLAFFLFVVLGISLYLVALGRSIWHHHAAQYDAARFNSIDGKDRRLDLNSMELSKASLAGATSPHEGPDWRDFPDLDASRALWICSLGTFSVGLALSAIGLFLLGTPWVWMLTVVGLVAMFILIAMSQRRAGRARRLIAEKFDLTPEEASALVLRTANRLIASFLAVRPTTPEP